MSSLPPDPLSPADGLAMPARPDPQEPGAAPTSLARSGGAADPWWPRSALGTALARAGRAQGRAPSSATLPAPDLAPDLPPDTPGTALALADWAQQAAAGCGLRIERQTVPAAQAAEHLAALGPALVWDADGSRFLLLTGRGGLALPGGGHLRLTARALEGLILPAPHPSLQRQARRLQALAGGDLPLLMPLQAQALTGHRIEGIWALRPDRPGLRAALRAERLVPLILCILMAGFLAQGAEVWLWRRAATGPSGLGLALALFAPAALAAVQGLGAEALLRALMRLVRRRLLRGALNLPDAALRAEGPAGLMAAALEAQGFETALAAAILGGVGAAAALIWAVLVLAQGLWPVLFLPLLAALLAVQAWTMSRFQTRFRAWTEGRRALTARMIEALIGHRTITSDRGEAARLAEDAPLLADQNARAARMDRASLPAFALLPNGWIVLALTLILLGRGMDPSGLATLGGIVLAGRALSAMAAFRAAWGAARIALDQIAPLWRAADARPETAVSPAPDGANAIPAQDGAIAAPPPGLPVAPGLTLTPGMRVLLTGPSGAGKSTLLRRLALPDGAAPPRRQIALVPQYHDNHIFNGSMAYNLLLARGWPAGAADLAEAEATARHLGLGPLIDRMPGGMQTLLGDTGWQLSQGERSRVFLARALLQGAGALALDESLAALDPETATLCLSQLAQAAPALILAAHP